MLQKVCKNFFSSGVQQNQLSQEEIQKAFKQLIDEYKKNAFDKSTKTLIVDYRKCTKENCTNCAQICDKRVFAFSKLGDKAFLQTSTAEKLANTKCNKCGQCAMYCPTGAISICSSVEDVREALSSKNGYKHSVVFFDSSVVSVLSDILKRKITQKQLIRMLRDVGFEYVFNGDVAEDIFILEEAEELERTSKENKLLISSHCPAFKKHLIREFGEKAMDLISPVKMPTNIMVDTIKQIVEEPLIVSVSCCAAAKETAESSFHLTTKELSELIKDVLDKDGESDFDKPLDEATGSAAICGTSGGVMESVMRVVTKSDVQYEYNSLRNFEDIVRISRIANKIVCVTTSDSVGSDILNRILKKDKIPEGICYIEGSSCPGGCLNGGGNIAIQDAIELKRRYSRVYDYDRQKENRSSHLNENIKQLYKQLFQDEKIGSEKAKKQFHEEY